MALTNYTTLQTAVINALHRSDLASSVPDFITLAEDKLNKRLRIRGMETRVNTTVTGGVEYVALPDGFLSAKNFQVNTSPRTRLEFASPEWLDINFPSPISIGTPRFFTFVGGQIQLAPIPNGDYELEMDYYEKLDLATDSTNWVLTNAPRVYYYGALMEASAYLVNDKRVPLWSRMLEQAILEIERADDMDDLPAYGLQVRPDLTV